MYCISKSKPSVYPENECIQDFNTIMDFSILSLHYYGFYLEVVKETSQVFFQLFPIKYLTRSA